MKKKIAFVITKAEIGGAQTWVYEISKSLNQDCDILLITSEIGWLTEQPLFTNVEIVPEISGYASIYCVFKVANLLRRYEIDTVIASSANAGIYSRLAKIFYDFKCIYVSHGWSCLYNGGKLKKAFCLAERYLSYLSDVILCVSKSDEDKAIFNIGIKPNKIVTIRNSIYPLECREKRKFEGKVLFVGRLTYPKRPDLIIEAIIENKCSEYRLDIVGDGDMFRYLKEKYASFCNITFLGEFKAFRNYSEYDIFVLSSDSEGLPMSALEAASSGLPMILSNVGGCAEILASGSGVLVENNKEEFMAALNMISHSYDDFFCNAVERRGNFDITNIIDEYKKIIFN